MWLGRSESLSGGEEMRNCRFVGAAESSGELPEGAGFSTKT